MGVRGLDADSDVKDPLFLESLSDRGAGTPAVDCDEAERAKLKSLASRRSKVRTEVAVDVQGIKPASAAVLARDRGEKYRHKTRYG